VGILSIFRDYGYRRLRTAPAEVPGRGLGCGEVPPDPRGQTTSSGNSSTARPPTSRSPGGATTSVCTARTTARFYVGFRTARRRVDGTTAHEDRRAGAAHGSGRLVPPSSRDDRARRGGRPGRVAGGGLEPLDLTARPSTFRRGTMACTGIEYCKLATSRPGARCFPDRRTRKRRIPSSTSQSPSTSTAARRLRPYPGRGHRLRASWSFNEPGAEAGRGLPGAPGRRARPGAGFGPRSVA